MFNWKKWRNLFKFKVKAPKQEKPTANSVAKKADSILTDGPTALGFTPIVIRIKEDFFYELMARLGPRQTFEDCLNDAVSLFQWALSEIEENRVIGSAQERGEGCREIVMSWMKYPKRLARIRIIKDEIDDPEALTALDECI